MASNGKLLQQIDYFENFMKELFPEYDKTKILSKKIFEFVKKVNSNDNSPSSISKSPGTKSRPRTQRSPRTPPKNIVYSLNDLVKQSQEFLSNTQFKLCSGDRVKYVQIRIKSIIH